MDFCTLWLLIIFVVGPAIKIAASMLKAMAKDAAEAGRQRQEQALLEAERRQRRREEDERMLAMEERLRLAMMQQQQMALMHQQPQQPQIIVVQPGAGAAPRMSDKQIAQLPMAEVIDAEVIAPRPPKPKALTWRRKQE